MIKWKKLSLPICRFNPLPSRFHYLETVLAVTIIIAVGFIIYCNAVKGEFIWDDRANIKDNLQLRSWFNLPKVFTRDYEGGVNNNSSFYRPVTAFTYMLDYSLWKLNPAGYHIINIFLHIATAVSIYWLMNILLKNYLLSFFAAVLFVVHPVHTETVAYISDRADMLAALFLILSFSFYIKHLKTNSKTTYFFAMVTCALCFLSKENGLVLPGIILLYHYVFKEKIRVFAFSSIIGIVVLYVLLRINVLGVTTVSAMGFSSMLDRLPGFFAALVAYIRLLFFPFHLHMEYGRDLFPITHPKVLLGIIMTLIILIYTFKNRDKDKILMFFVGWFFITILPVSNIFPLAFYMSEHWLYLPSICFFVLLARLVEALYRKNRYRPMVIGGVIGIIFFHSGLTMKQTDYWKDPITLYNRTLKYAPDSARVYLNLGVAYDDAGEVEKAAAAYKKAIELHPDFVEAYSNLGVKYKNSGEYEKAISLFNKAIEINPRFEEAYNNLGITYRNMKAYARAIAFYKKAIELNPEYADAYYNLGLAYNELGEKQAAIDSLAKVIQIDPGFVQAYNNLGVVYSSIGENNRAISLFEKALKISPYDGEIYSNLAIAHFYKKEYQLSVRYYDKAKKLGSIDDNLANALRDYME